MAFVSRTCLGLVITAILAGGANAQDWEKSLLACGQLSGAAERLACYDRIAGQVRRGSPQPPPGEALPPPEPTNPKPAVVQGESDRLGEKYLERTKRKKKEKPQDFEVVVTRVDRDARGRMRYFLENGQIWRQAIDRSVSKPRSLPIAAKIKVGFLGSHAIRIEGTKSSVKVKRVK